MNNLKRGEKVKDVKGYEGVYSITTLGRVWSYRRKKWLKPWSNKKGYMQVTLCECGKESNPTLHRLVGMTFLVNPKERPQINHKNGIKSDCRVCNLEWVTARENMQHAGDTGLNKTFKLTLVEKLLICRMHIILKVKQVYLARRFNVSPPAISYIIKEYSDVAIA